VPRIGIGKHLADVSESGGAKESIRHGVHHDIGVGMPFKTELKWNADAAQDERSSGHKSV
jgi:hypothetical protein